MIKISPLLREQISPKSAQGKHETSGCGQGVTSLQSHTLHSPLGPYCSALSLLITKTDRCRKSMVITFINPVWISKISDLRGRKTKKIYAQNKTNKKFRCSVRLSVASSYLSLGLTQKSICK